MTHTPRDEDNWARPVNKLQVSEVPAGAIYLNVEGRQLLSPLRGFGPLWQKTYRVWLRGATVPPAEVVKVWKEHFPEFHPRYNKFFASPQGVKPGEIMLINAQPAFFPPVAAGVMIMYSDDESFTVTTPQGFPESGWNTFSALDDEGVTVAQIQSMARATDPIYEIGFRLVGSKQQENIWRHVLTQLAAHFGVQAEVELKKTCLDPQVQWSEAGNVWHNAMIRTMIAAPKRWFRRMFGRSI